MMTTETIRMSNSTVSNFLYMTKFLDNNEHFTTHVFLNERKNIKHRSIDKVAKFLFKNIQNTK